MPRFLPKSPMGRIPLAAAAGALVFAVFYAVLSEDFDDNRSRIEVERIRGVGLDEGFPRAQSRSAIKRYWVAELLAGRADLVAVAGHFAEADRDCDGCIAAAERRCPGCSEEEKGARSVLASVRLSIEDAAAPPESWARVMAEYRSRYGRFDEPGPSIPMPGQVQVPMPRANG